MKEAEGGSWAGALAGPTATCQASKKAGYSVFYIAGAFTALVLNISLRSACFPSSMVFNTRSQQLWQLEGLIST